MPSSKMAKTPKPTYPAKPTQAAEGETEAPKRGRPRKSSAAPPSQKNKKPRASTFKIYIFKLLKSTAGECTISMKAMSIMNSFVNDIFERVANEAARVACMNKKCTISAREIQTSVKLVIPGQLATHAISEGTKAVMKYNREA